MKGLHYHDESACVDSCLDKKGDLVSIIPHVSLSCIVAVDARNFGILFDLNFHSSGQCAPEMRIMITNII